jgi:hypothetical protein
MACLSGRIPSLDYCGTRWSGLKNLGVCASRASVTVALAARTGDRMDPDAKIRALRAAFRRQMTPLKRGKNPFKGT